MAKVAVPYVNYEDLKTYLGTSETGDDTLLKNLCARASRVWEMATNQRYFYPRSEERLYDHPADTGCLKLDDDLLEVTTFTTSNGDTDIDSDDYFLMCGRNYNLTPYDHIEMKTSGDQTNLQYSGTLQQANSVTGIWGYHEDWNYAWRNSQDTVQNETQISASGTALTVSDADGANLLGVTPRFKVDTLLKIESEYLYITGKNTSTDILTVLRGVNGTTAAIHATGTTIYTYHVQDEIEHWVLRLAAWLYRQKDNSADMDRAVVTDYGGMLLPSKIPSDVAAAAELYRRWK